LSRNSNNHKNNPKLFMIDYTLKEKRINSLNNQM
jgi:hypothetical protein